jgi:Cu+-exporting ATPase
MTRSLDLPIDGMTCASCASRIERKLNRLDGVEASVNYATERASVAFDPALVQPAALLAAVEAAGYHATLPGDAATDAAAERDPLGDLRVRVLVAAILSVPIVALAMVPVLRVGSWEWSSLALVSVVVFWSGWQFHRAAWVNLRHGAATMDTLISMGTLAAWVWSLVALAWLGGELYFEVAAAVITFVLAGRYFELRAKRRAGSAIESLLELGAKDVAILGEGAIEHRRPIEQLRVGDRFVVRPGEQVASDGVVEAGRSTVDQSIVTGESPPVEVAPGAEVIGATINVGGRLVVRASRVGADTALAQIARMVTQAQSGKAPVQRLADRISAIFVPIVLVLALGTLVFWLAAGNGAQFAFTAAVAVLIVACPCALGLATPTALLVGTGRGAQLGLLIKGPEVLESTRRVDTIVLDKTGTVTTGQMSLQLVEVAEGFERAEVLRLVGALEAGSEHPIGQALVRAALDDAGSLPAIQSFENLDGLGVRGEVDGHELVIGRPSLLPDATAAIADVVRDAQADGSTAILASVDGAFAGVFVVADTIKPTSAAAIHALRELGLTPVLLTGDNEGAARAVAREVGIDDVVADVLPAGKADVVRRLQDEGGIFAMVGYGVNDSPALAQADLGLAIGTGTDVAIEASDLTLVSGDLHAAVDAIRLARRTLTTIKGNLFWAFAYNVAALPLAASGHLSPMIAGAAMAFSSVFVVSNSLRLRRFSTHR